MIFFCRDEYLSFFLKKCCLLILLTSLQGGKASSLYGTSTSDGRYASSNSTNQYREVFSIAATLFLIHTNTVIPIHNHRWCVHTSPRYTRGFITKDASPNPSFQVGGRVISLGLVTEATPVPRQSPPLLVVTSLRCNGLPPTCEFYHQGDAVTCAVVVVTIHSQ